MAIMGAGLSAIVLYLLSSRDHIRPKRLLLVGLGLLYGHVGIKMVIIINAMSFLLSAFLELFLEDLEVKMKLKNPLRKSVQEMVRSFNYLKEKKKVVLGIIFSYALTNIFVVPVLSVVSPFFINVTLNLESSIYGYIEAVFVLGMIVGG